jgi:LAS superfamily LD-carboxypeptidase LdcB
MNIEILLGKTTEHLVPVAGTKFLVHEQMLKDFLKLQRAALEAGFELQIASAFRDYDRQLKIWNAKSSGERVVLDENERPLDVATMPPKDLALAILRWSALPGCSRHHWGSDIDVFDARLQELKDVQLVSSECYPPGPAAAMHEWLDQRIKAEEAFGFFRPYQTDRGGVLPERWHLSYYPISRRMIDVFTYSIFKRNLEMNEIALKDELLQMGPEIFERFILNFDLP